MRYALVFSGGLVVGFVLGVMAEIVSENDRYFAHIRPATDEEISQAAKMFAEGGAD